MVNGFCGEKCPVKKELDDIESRVPKYGYCGFLSDEPTRSALVALGRALANQGDCSDGPDIFTDAATIYYSEHTVYTTCRHSNKHKIEKIGDAVHFPLSSTIETEHVN